jgi:hypothetical protein
MNPQLATVLLDIGSVIALIGAIVGVYLTPTRVHRLTIAIVINTGFLLITGAMWVSYSIGALSLFSLSVAIVLAIVGIVYTWWYWWFSKQWKASAATPNLHQTNYG